MTDEHGTETGTEQGLLYAERLYRNVVHDACGNRHAPGHMKLTVTVAELMLVVDEAQSLAAERDTLRAEVERLRGGIITAMNDLFEGQDLPEDIHTSLGNALTPPAPAEQRGETQGVSDG